MMLIINHLGGAKINFRKGANFSCRNHLAGSTIVQPVLQDGGHCNQNLWFSWAACSIMKDIFPGPIIAQLERAAARDRAVLG
jgi:hypothetical protein